MPKVQLPLSLRRVFGTSRVRAGFRRAGDQARDAKRWNDAAGYYAAFLKHAPDDVMIRVQLGNCLKEAGRFAEALAAYDGAIGLDDAHADGHLQRGHLLKLMGRTLESAAEYRRSFELNSQSNPAFEELLQLGVPGAAVDTGTDDGATVYIDVTDLIDYLGFNVSLSGIQRVVTNLIRYARAASAAGGSSVRFALPDYEGLRVFTVSTSLLDGLIGLIAGQGRNREMLDRALHGVRGSQSPARPKAGDTFLIPGAFWVCKRYDLLNTMRQNGVRIAVLIHDLIQITNPEFVEPVATTNFRNGIVDLLCVSSYVLTNSEFVANDVRRYVAERMNFSIPVTAVPLATELGTDRLDIDAVQDEYLALAKEDYVLCVGTIEIRKNHLYLIKLWERLIEQSGEQVPNLVIVGKWGWEIVQFQKWLAGSDYLGGKLYVFDAISDNDLMFLYQNCLFTISASFAEGWGLPIGESLSYGKPCIASGVTAIPEVGGALCKYFDPFDLQSGYRVVSEVLADRSALDRWARQVRQEFVPRTWEGFATELFKTVQHYGRDPAFGGTGNNCVIESGEIATFGDDPLAQLDAKGRKLVTARMTRMTGWHGLEAWGCWAAKRRATLRVRTRLRAGTQATVYLHLKAPDGAELADCTVKVNQTTSFIDQLGSVPVWCTVSGEVGDDGVIDILLISGKGFIHHGGREVYLGILGVAVAPTDDWATRFELLGRIVPGGVPLQPGASAGL